MNHFHVIEPVSLVLKKNKHSNVYSIYSTLRLFFFPLPGCFCLKEWGLFVIKDQQSIGITPSTLEMLLIPNSCMLHPYLPDFAT